jgi:hypothetical protein
MAGMRFRVVYGGGGEDEGDVVIGAYLDPGPGAQWDQSEGTFTVKGWIIADGGTIAGWDINATQISKAGITLDSAYNRLRVSNGSNFVDISPAGILGHDSTLGDVFKLPTNGSAPEFSSGVIKECEYQLYTAGIIRTNANPASTGGLIINNTSITGYDSSGGIRLKAVYNGADEGDFLAGNYDGGKGIKYDQSANTFDVRGGFTTSTGSVKRFELSATDNEAHFYGDQGNGSIVELASIGIKPSGSDYTIGLFGNQNTGNSRIALSGLAKIQDAIQGFSDSGSGVHGYSESSIGVLGESNSYDAVRGSSTDGIGVSGLSTNSYGGYFLGGLAPLRLVPSVSASAPTHSAGAGSLWLTSACVLYVNTNGSTTWQKVGAQ